MPAKKTLHVLADSKGKIIGAAFLDESASTGSAHAQVVPLAGQRLVKVSLTTQLGRLESPDDFRRITSEFHLPRGRTELSRKRTKASAFGKKRRRAS